jgi:redox-sensitive bicupin YhaK (pirin superfamily)
MGNQGRTAAGDVQVMSAGTGVRHAEYNLEPGLTTLFQIWIEPRQRGGAPSWGTKPFPRGDRSGKFVALASGFPEDTDALPIRTDARVLGAQLKAGDSLAYEAKPERHLYVVAAAGAVELNEVALNTRDGAAITGETVLTFTAKEDAELVMVDAA